MAEPYMTMAEIAAKYPNEWVLIANPTKKRRSQAPTGGQVVIHCADRAEFLLRFAEWDDPNCKHVATWYMGKERGEDIMPADSESGAA